MTEAAEPCAFTPCGQPIAVTLRMMVEGEDLVLPVCQAHVEWLKSYVEKDGVTRIVDLVPAESPSPAGTEVSGTLGEDESLELELEHGESVDGARSDQ